MQNTSADMQIVPIQKCFTIKETPSVVNTDQAKIPIPCDPIKTLSSLPVGGAE